MTVALNKRFRPLGHATLASSWRCLVSVVSMIFNICHQWIYNIKSIFTKYCALPSTEPHFHTQNVKYVPLSIMEQKNQFVNGIVPSPNSGIAMQKKRITQLAAVGFEPTPSKWLVPETSALDNSATPPSLSLDADLLIKLSWIWNWYHKRL